MMLQDKDGDLAVSHAKKLSLVLGTRSRAPTRQPCGRLTAARQIEVAGECPQARTPSFARGKLIDRWRNSAKKICHTALYTEYRTPIAACTQEETTHEYPRQSP